MKQLAAVAAPKAIATAPPDERVGNRNEEVGRVERRQRLLRRARNDPVQAQDFWSNRTDHAPEEPPETSAGDSQSAAPASLNDQLERYERTDCSTPISRRP